MQTEAARGGEWFAGVEPALPAPRGAVCKRESRRATSERVALGVVLVLSAIGVTVLGLAVALAPGLYTPFF